MANLKRRYGAFNVNQICPSSWVSWSCYAAGLFLAMTPNALMDLAQGGIGAAVLTSSILLFFVSASLVQRYMRLSLLSGSYGKPQTLTTGGIFGVTRNPFYVAFLLPLLSISYYSVSAALTASIMYVGMMTAFIIRSEEVILSETFGAAYDEYAAKTPRWLFF